MRIFRRANPTVVALLATALSAASMAWAESEPRAIPFAVISDDVALTARTSRTHRVFTSAAEYAAFFGRQAPSDIDFTREWLIFYTPGTERTGGYEAHIEKVSLASDGPTLSITTSLVFPARDCVVTQSLTTPAVLARFQRPDPPPADIRFDSNDHERACGSADPCAAVRCAAGTMCVVKDGSAACEAQACRTDADCALVDDYCGGCNCRAALRGAPAPQCGNPVQCFRQPCSGSVARCREGACVAAPRETTR